MEGRLLINWADRAGLLVLDGSRFRDDWCFVLDCNLKTKLELGLSSTIELLVDGGVVWVKSYEGCCTIGIAFEDSFGGRRDGKEEA